MSELMNATGGEQSVRWRLLVTVSALALSSAVIASPSKAQESTQPTFWIELGGQLERVDGGQERFAPPFVSMVDTGAFTSPIAVQRPPRYAIGAEVKATLSPQNSDWVFSAAIRYGRSNNKRNVHQELGFETAEELLSVPLLGLYETRTVTADAKRYSDTTFENRESHAIVDFQAGKDIGLGLFGSGGTSVISAGVRFAQFESESKVSIGGDPDFAFSYKYATKIFGLSGNFKIPLQRWHLFTSNSDMTHSFHGMGPSISWAGDAPVLGDSEKAELTLDWGMNAAILFGRQKTKGHHETVNRYRPTDPTIISNATVLTQVYHHAYNPSRSRSVIVPNLGGFAGFSLKFPNAKVSLGYRADFFFGAVDGGIDTRTTYDRSFYGPFATISIGLGG